MSTVDLFNLVSSFSKLDLKLYPVSVVSALFPAQQTPVKKKKKRLKSRKERNRLRLEREKNNIQQKDLSTNINNIV